MLRWLVRRISDRNIYVVYVAILLLGMAYGVSIAVLAIHLAANHIPKLAMGGLAAAFALGIVVFALPAAWFVQRLGAKTTMVVALVGYASCVATLPLLTTARALSVARFFDGAFSVAVWVAAETSLLARSDKTNKALVMSLYALSLAFGYVLGPILALGIVKAAGTGASFFVAGIFACVASLVLFTGLDRSRTESGAHHIADGRARTPARAVLWRTKTSCLATFSYGYFQASVVLFLPLFLIETKHVPESRTILVTAFFAGGMVISSTFMGRLGDRYGHLLVMRLLATVGAAMVASFVVLSSFEAMCASVFVAGATLASISPVSLALQGVVVQERDLGRANAFYNATYAAGMLLGPPVSSLLFTKLGGDAMLLHLAAIWAVFVTFTMVFANDDPRRALLRASALGARPVHGECGHPERGERIAAREYPAGGEATVSLGRDIRP